MARKGIALFWFWVAFFTPLLLVESQVGVGVIIVMAATIVAILWWRKKKVPRQRQTSSGKRKNDVEETSEASLSNKARDMMAVFWFWLALFTPLLVVQPELAVGMGSGADYYWDFMCSSGNFTPGSAFETYLKSAASRLPAQTASAPQFFTNESIGLQTEQLYAMAICRGDSNATMCRTCVSDALREAPVACPFKRGVIMLYECCTVALSDKEFEMFSMNISANDRSFLKYNSSWAPVPSEMVRKGAISLVASVVDKAAETHTNFATGRKELDTDGHTVYTLAQCIPGMTSSNCQDCLRFLASEETYSETGAVGGRISNIWCQYRWELFAFFNGQPLLDLRADHHQKHIWVIVGIVVGVAIVITAAILLIVWWRKRLSRIKRSSGEKKKGVDETSNIELSIKEGCPSALDFFEEVINLAQGRQIALFLDYDGTLSPIVTNPDRAFMSEEMRTTVRKAATLFTTSIVSGRAREKVMDFVKITEINYAGSHGLDIMTTATAGSTSTSEISGVPCLYEPAKDDLSDINEVREFLVRAADSIIGATVENNKYCLSVHYRNVADEDKLRVKQVVIDAEEKYSFKLTEGHMVYELRPPVDWNKGHTVGYLLKTLGLDNPENTFAVYIGDDRTDEDAFQVLREQQKGIGILVAERIKPTAAYYSVKNPNEVKTFLERMVEWGER